MEHANSAQHEFSLYIYQVHVMLALGLICSDAVQVTMPSLCDWLEDFHKTSGRTLRVLVSYSIFSESDYKLAQECYQQVEWALW